MRTSALTGDPDAIWWVQVKVSAQPLAGSPGGSPAGDLARDTPSSQAESSAAGSPWSPVSSPDWHTTPRWPQFANFGAHSSRPANPSTLSHVTSAAPVVANHQSASPDSQVIPCCCLRNHPLIKATVKLIGHVC